MYIHVRVNNRYLHWWFKMVTNPFHMYPYVNAWIAEVRSLKCNMKLTCLLCYSVLCGLCLKEYYGLREWMPEYVVDSHYVIMFTNVHTYSLTCMLQVVEVMMSKWKVVLIFTNVYYYACKVYVCEVCFVLLTRMT